MQNEAETARLLRANYVQTVAGPSVVYFVQSVTGGPIKIGWTTNAKARIAGFQKACPFRLTVLATCLGNREHESALHNRFRDARLHGEWFDPVPDLVEFIAACVADPAIFGKGIPWERQSPTYRPRATPRRTSEPDAVDLAFSRAVAEMVETGEIHDYVAAQ